MHKVLLLLLLAGSIVVGFDHRYPMYSKLLALYVENGSVHYDKLKTDTDIIRTVRREFSAADKAVFEKFTEKERIAYLVNLYNFYTIDLIVQNLPLKNGIKDIEKPWDIKFVPFSGKKVSLNHIEHEILRKQFREPGIHFALVCASKSCPVLPGKPFDAMNLDTQLKQSAVLFLQDRSKNRIDSTTLYLSQIFEWYGQDFKGGYLEYIGRVMGIPVDGVIVKFLPYNWDLNDAGR